MWQISIDLALILRVLLAFGWGIGWASYLQFNRHGQFLSNERTWLTVVIGIGVDLLIAYPADWYTVAFVISASSLGIIFRSLWNEHKYTELNGKSYKLLWTLEDSIALAGSSVETVNLLLKSGTMNAASTHQLSILLTQLHQLKSLLVEARKGNNK